MVNSITTPLTTSLLTQVSARTNIRQDDGYVATLVKIPVGIVAKVATCVLAALEFLARAVLLTASLPIAPFIQNTFSKMAQQTKEAGQNVFKSLFAISQLRGSSVEVKRTPQGRMANLKNALNTSYLKALNGVKAHQRKVAVVTGIAVTAIIGYALHRTGGTNAITNLFIKRNVPYYLKEYGNNLKLFAKGLRNKSFNYQPALTTLQNLWGLSRVAGGLTAAVSVLACVLVAAGLWKGVRKGGGLVCNPALNCVKTCADKAQNTQWVERNVEAYNKNIDAVNNKKEPKDPVSCCFPCANRVLNYLVKIPIILNKPKQK